MKRFRYEMRLIEIDSTGQPTGKRGEFTSGTIEESTIRAGIDRLTEELRLKEISQEWWNRVDFTLNLITIPHTQGPNDEHGIPVPGFEAEVALLFEMSEQAAYIQLGMEEQLKVKIQFRSAGQQAQVN